jgi:hypothetical protein
MSGIWFLCLLLCWYLILSKEKAEYTVAWEEQICQVASKCVSIGRETVKMTSLCIAPKRSRFFLQHAYDSPPIITIVSAALHKTISNGLLNGNFKLLKPLEYPCWRWSGGESRWKLSTCLNWSRSATRQCFNCWKWASA